jgi:hypothetical protein
MRGYTIKSQRIYSTKNIVRCKVCGRRPRKNRLVYEITYTDPEKNRVSSVAPLGSRYNAYTENYVFHEGYTDTMKCALNIVLAGK